MPPRRVDLHIGLEKTGTTTIQEAMHASRQRLAGHGILYPTSLGQANHTALAVVGRDDDVVDDLRQRRGLRSPDAVRSFRDAIGQELEQEVAAAAAHTVVVSGEHCSSRLTTDREVELL